MDIREIFHENIAKEIIYLINNTQNDDDIINLFIKFDKNDIHNYLHGNIFKINNKKYLNYFKGLCSQNKHNLIKKYYSLNKKLYNYAYLLENTLNFKKYKKKYKFYAKYSLNYMINRNILFDKRRYITLKYYFFDKKNRLYFNLKDKDCYRIIDIKYIILFILKK